MTIKDVARDPGVSESMIRGIEKAYLNKNFGKVKKFLSILIDRMTGTIIMFVGAGKGEKALRPFWKRLRSSGAKIEAVATDMPSAYFSAVRKKLPGAMSKKTANGLRWLLLKHSDNPDPGKNEAQRLR
ncbi:MAG: hypothetical protein RLZZ436_848 [Planctomycetota bacterium]